MKQNTKHEQWTIESLHVKQEQSQSSKRLVKSNMAACPESLVSGQSEPSIGQR